MQHDRPSAGRILRFAWIVLFLAFCLVPSLGMALVGETQASANEILAVKPKLVEKNGSWNARYLNDLSDYIADRFAFRKPLINAWAELNAKLFRSSAEEQIVLGQEGWLYYASTLDDYMGRAMSEEELKLAASYLASLQHECESRGARFYFTIAPNKNSLYGDQMPAYIPEAHAASNAERLKPLLAEYAVHYIDLFEVFAGKGETLYYRTDSHWTDRGAALAADSLLGAMGKKTRYYAGDFAAGEEHLGDLYDMLFPTGKFRETSEIYVPGFSYTLSGNPNGGNAMAIRSTCRGKSGTLVCWRDSFGISLYPYLADSYENAVFLRSAAYDLDEIEKNGADTVLIELVERNLGRLAEAGRKLSASD